MQKILIATLLISFNTFASEELYSLSNAQILTAKSSCQSKIQRKVSLSKINLHKNRLKNELTKVQNCAIISATEDLINLCTQNDLHAEFTSAPRVQTSCSSKVTKYNGQDYNLITCQTTAKVECLSI